MAEALESTADTMPTQPVGTAIKLTLTRLSDPERIVESLLEVVKSHKQDQKVIQEVHVTVDSSFNVAVLMTNPGRALMKSLGRLADLKRMIIQGQFMAPFPVSALCRFFYTARRLERFSLFQMTLVGSATDFERFGRYAVSLHTASLQVFDIDMIQLLHRPGTPIVQRPALDPLLTALNQCHKLKVLLLGGCEASSLNGTFSLELVHQLFLSKTIHRLSLVNIPISTKQLCRITKALQVNDTLKHLCLSCSDVSADKALEREAIMDPSTKVAQDCESKLSLSSMLQNNKTLEKLILFLPHLDQDEDFNLEIFRSAERSSTLKGLYLGSLERMTLLCKEALMQMFQNNFVLEEFGFVCANQGAALSSQFYPCSVDAIQEMTMLLRLNKDISRGKLLRNENASQQEWVDALIKVKDELDCVFYLLSQNPALMSDTSGSNTLGKRGRARCSIEMKGPRGDRIKRRRLYRAAKYKNISYRG